MEKREEEFRGKLAKLGIHRVKAMVQNRYWNTESELMTAFEWISEQEAAAAKSTHRWAIAATVVGVVSVIATIAVAFL